MENYLAREASVATGLEVPILGAVVGAPHPFQSKQFIEGQNGVIELEELQEPRNVPRAKRQNWKKKRKQQRKVVSSAA